MKKLSGVLVLALLATGFAFAQSWDEEPSFGQIDLEAGFYPDPTEVEIVGGGSIDVSSVSELGNLGGAGYIAQAPDLNLFYDTDGTFALTIKVEGDGEDTVLVVRSPSGAWFFNDDENGVDPAITFGEPESGLYNIWVGSYWEDEYVDIRLLITELD